MICTPMMPMPLSPKTELTNQPDVLRALFDATTDFVYMKDRDGIYVAMNVAGASGLGKTPDQVIGKDDFDLFPRETAERWRMEDRKVLETGKSISTEQEFLRDGVLLYLHTLKSPWRSDRGEVIGVVGVSRDVTLRRRAEIALRSAESRFQKLFASDLMGIHIPDRYGAITEANDEFLRIVGYSRIELEAGEVRWDTMTPPEYVSIDQAHIAEAARRGTCTPYEKEYVRKDGSRVPIMCGYTLLEGSDDTYIAFIQDLSALKKSEEALRQAEKLNTASRFAASMAHEINNPLAAVTNLIYLSLRDQSIQPESQKLLETADQELARISRIVAQTLRFHKQLTASVQADICEVLESVFPLFASRLSRNDIRIQRDYRTSEKLWCFNNDLRHAFANLVGNALDAMPNGGRLWVRVRKVHREHSGSGIKVSVGDNGHGIPDSMRKRMFEPFLTTKEATGTGLGLWATENIVRKHHGTIHVRTCTRPGRSGTIFSLFLPFNGVAPAAPGQ